MRFRYGLGCPKCPEPPGRLRRWLSWWWRLVTTKRWPRKVQRHEPCGACKAVTVWWEWY